MSYRPEAKQFGVAGFFFNIKSLNGPNTLAGFLLSQLLVELLRNRDLRVVAHFALWSVLFGALLWMSVPRIWRAGSRFSAQFVGSEDHSNDIFLGEDGGSKRLIKLLHSRPIARSVIIFVRRNDHRSQSLGMLAAYLAWPRPVRIVDAAQFPWANEAATNELGAAAAIVFCQIDPPLPRSRTEQIGASVRVLMIDRVATR